MIEITVAPPRQRSLVSERFNLPWLTKDILRRMSPNWGYGPFSEFVFYRTYARDGERWADVIVRVIEGTFSIRKQHYLDHGIPWDEEAMAARAHEMAVSAFRGEWGPPGRGYWAMGTDMVYERGSMALNNCGFSDVRVLSRDVHWAMDALMLGVGVGFSAQHDVVSGLRLPRTGGNRVRVPALREDGYPTGSYELARQHWGADELLFQVPDSREGWADSLRLLIESYEEGGPTVRFDYSALRPRGSRINGFGGEASGYWPLKKLHKQVRVVLGHATRHKGEWAPSRLITDVMNMVGCCIVAGNVRRSATIALGHPDDAEFAQLKNYGTMTWIGKTRTGKDIMQVTEPTKWSYRRRFGWMSNNSYVLSEREHFERMIPLIAEGIKRNGEPGFYNLKAVRSHGRLGDRVGTLLANGSVLREDLAIGINPCGEVPLESYELCCLAEWYPTRCLKDGKIDVEGALRAAEHAAFYTQTVQLLPTHRPETNAVIERNRRTGVSLAGAATILELTTMTEAIKLMEHGYDAIRRENKRLAQESRVPEAIRVTAEKPSGTTSLMMGVTSGAHWPTASRMIRRVRVDDERMALRQVLEAAGVPHEPDNWSANTEVYEFPVLTSERIRAAHEVTMWEQADLAATLAQHFVDNAVSVTVTFDKLTRQQKEAMGSEILRLYAQAERHDLECGDDDYCRSQVEERKTQLMTDFTALQRRQPEGDDVERLVASYAGKLKSMSMLPRSGHGYAQAPEEAIGREEYEARLAAIGELDWSRFHDQGVDELYCASCETV